MDLKVNLGIYKKYDNISRVPVTQHAPNVDEITSLRKASMSVNSFELAFMFLYGNFHTL